MQEIKSVFGKNVQKYRKLLKLTQEELAEKIDVSQTFLANIERGKRGASMETIELLAKSLSIPYTALFETEKEEPVSTINKKVFYYDLEESLRDSIETAVHECIKKNLNSSK